jgi:hypothetical protein
MRPHRLAMVVMTAGQLVLASGQTFNRRYDTFQQGYAQAAWSIDPNGTDGYAVTVATFLEDSLNIYVTVAMVRLNTGGSVLSETTMLNGLYSYYAGWANSAQRTRDGGLVIGGGARPPGSFSNASLMRYGSNGDSIWLKDPNEGWGLLALR